jgi:hypothetical protein
MTSKKPALLLGYTRTGHEVLLPNRRTPDMEQFASWAPGDHLDASRILVEHGEREVDPIGLWCARWADEHRAIGKRARKKQRHRAQVRGAAEILIRSPRRR